MLSVQRVLVLCDLFFFLFFVVIGSKIGGTDDNVFDLEVQVSSDQFVHVEFFYGVYVFSFVCDM